jgi:hypothetical protein
LNPWCLLKGPFNSWKKKITNLSKRRAIMNNHVVQRAHTKAFLSKKIKNKKLGLENVETKLI